MLDWDKQCSGNFPYVVVVRLAGAPVGTAIEHRYWHNLLSQSFWEACPNAALRV